MVKVVVENLAHTNEDVVDDRLEINLTPEQVITALVEQDSDALMRVLEGIVANEIFHKFKISPVDFSMQVTGNGGLNVYYPPLDG